MESGEDQAMVVIDVRTLLQNNELTSVIVRNNKHFGIFAFHMVLCSRGLTNTINLNKYLYTNSFLVILRTNK